MALSCFKQVSLNSTAIFALWITVNYGARLLSDGFLCKNVRAKSLPGGIIKRLEGGWNTKQFYDPLSSKTLLPIK